MSVTPLISALVAFDVYFLLCPLQLLYEQRWKEGCQVVNQR